MQFDIITIFPHILDSYIRESILKRAQAQKLITITTHDLRAATLDRHRTVDDKPYGGGVGMVMKVEPIYDTLVALERMQRNKVILVSPRGIPLTQSLVKKLTKEDQLIFVCGRYEGIDERVKKIIDLEVSLGPYVLAGGELPAMVVIEAVARLIPGVLGKDESSEIESHSNEGYLEYPHYTRPEVFRGWKVPKVLLSGDHKKIEAWKKKHAKGGPS